MSGGAEEQFLEDTGILTRRQYEIWGPVEEIVVQTHIRAFLDLEQDEPGAWALAQGDDSLLIKDRVLEEGRGALVELHRAIPVPNKDVALQDVLEFRERRRDDLTRLRVEIVESLRVAFPAACGEHEEWTPEYPAACGGDRLFLLVHK